MNLLEILNQLVTRCEQKIDQQKKLRNSLVCLIFIYRLLLSQQAMGIVSVK